LFLAVIVLLLVAGVALKVLVFPRPDEPRGAGAPPRAQADEKVDRQPNPPQTVNRTQEPGQPTQQPDNQDPLQVNTVWKGPGKQSGTFRGFPVPPDYTVTVRLTQREGKHFEGEWTGFMPSDGAVTTGKIRGTIDPVRPTDPAVKLGSGEYTFSFELYDLKRTSGGLFDSTNWKGFIKGKTLTGTWEHSDPARNSACEGKVTLQLVEM
jgi:hypothetical protein